MHRGDATVSLNQPTDRHSGGPASRLEVSQRLTGEKIALVRAYRRGYPRRAEIGELWFWLWLDADEHGRDAGSVGARHGRSALERRARCGEMNVVVARHSGGRCAARLGLRRAADQSERTPQHHTGPIASGCAQPMVGRLREPRAYTRVLAGFFVFQQRDFRPINRLYGCLALLMRALDRALALMIVCCPRLERARHKSHARARRSSSARVVQCGARRLCAVHGARHRPNEAARLTRFLRRWPLVQGFRAPPEILDKRAKKPPAASPWVQFRRARVAPSASNASAFATAHSHRPLPAISAGDRARSSGYLR